MQDKMNYGCIGERLSHSFSREIHLALADYGLFAEVVSVSGIFSVLCMNAHDILAKAVHTVAGAGVAHAFNNIGAAQGFDDKAIELKLPLGQLCI